MTEDRVFSNSVNRSENNEPSPTSGILAWICFVCWIALYLLKSKAAADGFMSGKNGWLLLLFVGLLGSLCGLAGVVLQRRRTSILPHMGGGLCLLAFVFTFFSYFYPVIYSGIYDFPSSASAVIEKDYCSMYENWLQNNTVKTYKALCTVNDTVNPDAVTFLSHVCRYKAFKPSGMSLQELESEAMNLIEGGLNHPIVLLWTGWILYEQKRYNDAWPYADKAMAAIDSMNVPFMQKFFGAYVVMKAKHHAENITAQDLQVIRDYCARALCDAVSSGEFKDNEIRIAYRLVDKVLDQEAYNTLLTCLNDKKEIDPWFLDMATGRVEVKRAWDDRGHGWASEVTEKGWKGFKEHLEKARVALTRAWTLHPEYPEAAGEMISLAMTGASLPEENEVFWFNRCVHAQIDYPQAYDHMFKALHPKWGGSEDAIEELGRACLTTRRFDTDVPLYYMYSMRTIASLQKNNRWRTIFHDDEIQKALDTLFEGMLNEPSRAGEQNKILTQKALVKLWGGKPAEARALLARAGGELPLSDGYVWTCLSWGCREKETIDAELRLYQDDGFLSAEQSLIRGDLEKAVAAFLELRERYGNDGEVQSYLLRRITLIKLDLEAEYVQKSYSNIYLAADEGDADVVDFLVKSGFDINTKNSWSGDTVLHVAAENNNTDMVRFLLSRGADINKTNDFQRTPLHSAALKKAYDTALLLIDSGANLEIKDKQEVTALFIAVRDNLDNLASALLTAGANANVKNCNHWTPLTMSVNNRNMAMTRRLIDHGADVNMPGFRGETALTLAVIASPLCARYLIEKGADIHHSLNDGTSLLHFALISRNKDMALFLIRKGADVNVLNDQGLNPANLAVSQQMPGVLRELVSHGADIHHMPSGTWTNVHEAATQGNVDVMKILIENGADITSLSPDGKTPLQIAKEHHHEGLVRLIESTLMQKDAQSI